MHYQQHVKVPKYLQLAEGLRQQMRDGVLRPGDRLPSFVEMRREYGATQNTVEKVFALLEKDGLIVREPSRGIFVAPTSATPAGEVLSGNQAPRGILGVSGPGFQFEVDATYWAELLRGMRMAADAEGVGLLLLDHTTTQGWERADGILVCDWSAHDILDRVPVAQPCVSVLVDLPEISSVTADDYQGGKLAAEYLLQLGHRKVAFLHGMDVHTVPSRLSGYRDALASAGIVPDGRWTSHLTDYYRNSAEFEVRAYEAMTRWIKRDWHQHGCTALLCQNDATALGAIRALQDAGYSVPGDVSVVGFDGVDKEPPLVGAMTSVVVPLREIGRRSVEVLMKQVRADAVSTERHVFPTTIRPGSTTGPTTEISRPGEQSS